MRLLSKENVQDVLIYSYTKCINGFAAYLDEAQVTSLKGNPGVISVFENQERILHTTHSWEFIGFEANGAPTLSSLQKKANFGEGVIIANLDTGVWPESKSFNDEGMGPVPSRWKGTCQAGGGFKCNKKLIGARYFNKGFASASPTPIPAEWNTARDTEGHGSHTLSTAGGSFGSSVASKSLPAGKFYPLINAAEARLPAAQPADAQLCQNGTLDARKVAGKIIVCLRGINSRVGKGHEAELAGAVGMILANDEESGSELLSDPHVLPAAHLTYTDGQAVMNYIKSTRNPTASISPVHTDLGVVPNPVMAAFSSRGPSLIEPAILKPDVTAPGVDVIAAYTEAVGPSELPFDKRRTPYITMSGTSMSCPHVSGIVGLLRAIHPDWSPAAIKSAIMTTAKTKSNSKKRILDADGQLATPFAYGAGHVNPNLAADPGLVYDTNVIDYLNFLCAHGYNSTFILEFSGVPYKCPEKASLAEFNYPSIAVPDLNGPVTVTRRVKNVGALGTYTVKVKAPPKVSVVVEPSSLEFKKAGEEKKFMVTFKPVMDGMPKDYTFGHLTWSDSNGHHVKSPLVVKHA
ncbi:PROPROTEIN CONVERTASE SUBTILISIN/KEXIN [Salix purpurea]|uniref:PROPROTEIN CONVERTASE SUBTILISIN/KEXIN n=1 Tax=Salix purpurea TaxID=77065 RepID=A0A9Q1A094_SALPP|nr:PROPROTEIN CONVERTASE SUBTILISIN/KEXIN [Salix purpurea]